MGSDPRELYQNLYACLRVGRLDRASVILERLTAVYKPNAPEVVDAHNIYLQTLFELSQQDPKPNSMAAIEKWHGHDLLRTGLTPNAQTYVILLRSAMNLVEASEQEAAVQRLIAMAHAQGEDILDEVNASAEFSDEEWDLLIRLQPETYDEPPPVADVQHIQIGTPSARKSLIEHGLLSSLKQDIKPVPQKGMGLDSLKQALSVLEAEFVPFPHDMEGTPEEIELQHAHARQLQIERDSMKAAVNRWKHEDEKLQEMGIHGVTNTKPVQAIMYSWYTSLVPLFKQHLDNQKKILSGSILENVGDDAHAYGPYLERCTPETLAALTVARCINACLRGKEEDVPSLKISTLSIALGTDVQDHLNADFRTRRDTFLNQQRKQTRRGLVERLAKAKNIARSSSTEPAFSSNNSGRTDISLVTRTKIGALCLELLLQSATVVATADDPRTGKQITSKMPAFHHHMGFQRGKKTGYIIPHHQLMTKLRTEPVHGISTVKLPMVVEPRPWSSFDVGGFYTTPGTVVRIKGGDTSQKTYAQSAIENGDMNHVLAGLDVLGKVPWQINAPVFEVMAEAWNAGEAIGKLVPEDYDMARPQEPSPDADYHERAAYNKELKHHENRRSGLHSQRCFQNFQLETARAYVTEKKIFFPHSVDFRGRAYPVSPILNHIGSDLSRGLLKFAHGKELGTVGLQWLKIHLANLYGFDKASLREREQFALDHLDDIRDSATNPLGGRRWWAKAEDPWQCLACCIELQQAFDLPDPSRFVSQLPVHQDGTCNGLQHYAALGGDHAGARQVNLEPSDRPQDIYTGVAELVKEMVAKDAEEGVAAAVYVNGHITRKVVKRTVMTNVYGVTFMGAKAQVYDELKDIFPNFKPTGKVKALPFVAMYVTYKIFDALGKIFNGAQEIQYWLGECGERITTSISAEQISQLQERFGGIEMTPYDEKYKPPKKVGSTLTKKMNKDMESFKTSIIWTTPLKMPIVQPYRKDTVKKIRTKIQDITVSRRNQSDVVDKRKQLQAFPPNFIHSLDATHMILSALKCSEMGLDFAAVHDSFWTHASDIPNLNIILRDAFVRMHSEDIVGRLAAEFSARYAGAMYRAQLYSTASVSQKITEWRYERRKANRQTLRRDKIRQGDALYEELALEGRRQELLKSDDPEEQRLGKEMVTPTSIWLAHQDPKAFTSFRLNLLGDTSNRKNSERQDEVRDKVLSAEAEAVADTIVQEPIESTLRVADEPATFEDEVDADDEVDVDAESSPKKRARSVQKGIVQVWIPLTFPPVPQKGGWDVSRLRESKYFFS